MVTPTYRDGVKWEPGHAGDLFHRMRQWYARRKVPFHYLWAMELTARGRPHYHVLVWVPSKLLLPAADAQGWWKWGSTRTEKARNPVGYLAKYASKGAGACDADGLEYRYPKSARICGGSVLEGEAATEWRYWISPRWARERVPEGTDLRRAAGGGYLVPSTGELLLSPWRFIGLSPCGKFMQFEPRGV